MHGKYKEGPGGNGNFAIALRIFWFWTETLATWSESRKQDGEHKGIGRLYVRRR